MAGLWILVLLVLGILTWSLWPSPIIHDSYKTSLDQPFITEQPCRVDKIFDGISFNLTYPEFTNSDSVFYIDLLVRKEISDQNLLLNGCDYALELLLDFPYSRIMPGSRLIQPLDKNATQEFLFSVHINSRNPKEKGTLWIYLVSKDLSEEAETKVPLFVIPVEVGVRNLIGIPVKWIQYAGFALVIILLFVIFFTKKLK